jgi:malonyl-CoA/methylmalonyl-CoA synthetase
MSNPLYDNLFGKYIGAKTSFIETSDGKIITHGGFVAMAARLSKCIQIYGIKER